ncbi:MAG TPA: outer membrane lipid asymmetry maintenance protein MlaD [Gammaproteobacteria bacterium]|nr:outer membrane lipid asymmetry maintenance protein MlaD [Gammaproteobacteria bacterium]
MNKRWIDLSLGLFFLLALVSLLFLAFWATSGPGQSETKYSAYGNFDDVSGLKERSPVRIAGVRVGEVTRILLLPDSFKAQVILSFYKADLGLPKDSVASIMTEGLLGSKYVNVEPGFEEAALEDGGRLLHTHSAIVLENILGLLLSGMGGSNEKKNTD